MAATVATALLFGGVLAAEDAAPRDAASAVPPLPAAAAAAAAAADLRELEQTVRRSPGDGAALTRLGSAYAEQFRTTVDPAFLTRADRVLRRAARLRPADPRPLEGLGAVALSRHRFAAALGLGRRVLRADPRSAVGWGIVGDALLELGRYRPAFAAFDRMAALEPGAAAYARISYARELLGRTDAAIAAMRLAVEASSYAPEPAAWSHVSLGQVQANVGRLAAADRAYAAALLVYPDYAPALAGRAQLAAWRGLPETAARLYGRALARDRRAEHAVGLGDSLAELGRAREASAAYLVARRLDLAFAAAGGRTALERAQFELDHDGDVRGALALARQGYRERPSIEGAHILAWAQYKNNRCKEARRHSVAALRLGTVDLDALYHRSLIEGCLGNRAAADSFLRRVRAANPYYLRTPPSGRRLNRATQAEAARGNGVEGQAP